MSKASIEPGTRHVAVCLALVVGLLTAACTESRYEAGNPIDIEALEGKLRLGESSAAEVRTVLGEPSGDGVVLLPIDAHPRKMWSYYYEKGLIKAGNDGKLDVDMRRTFLFVYFDKERYDGYMWFSSLLE